MCDTFVATPSATSDGLTWFGKNSDCEPGEAQFVEHLTARTYAPGSKLICTYLEIPQAPHTYEAFVSRPFWMWGAEMGANERGVAIGNEAVFTRLPYEKTGLTGMDLLRLALERSASALEALDLIIDLIARHGQGGGCGYRNGSFRYHNSFIIADPNQAWVLETAGPHWAAQQVKGVRTISNALSIGSDFDLVSGYAYKFAKGRGWCKSASDFNFAQCYSDPRYTRLSGGDIRRACTLGIIGSGRAGERDTFFRALRDHGGLCPADGWVMRMPCAHSSWQPARRQGQTTASMVASLSASGPTLWFTGTSSPCISVFKPARFGGAILDTGPPPGEGYDPHSLFWRHERLHRLILRDYAAASQLIQPERADLERRALASSDPPVASNRDFKQYWDEHREMVKEWAQRVASESRRKMIPSAFHIYWNKLNSQDGIPPSGRNR